MVRMIKIVVLVVSLFSASFSYAGPSCYMLDLSGEKRLTVSGVVFPILLEKIADFRNGYRVQGSHFPYSRVIVMSNGGGCEIVWFNLASGPNAEEYSVTQISNMTADGKIYMTAKGGQSFDAVLESLRR